MDCISTDQVLRPPAILDFSSYGQQSPPFTMNGAPVVGIPESMKGAIEKRRSPTATTDTSNKIAYFAADNYYDITILGENIFTGRDTSLRFKNNTYTLKFVALHANIWASSGLQVSLLFQTVDSHFFHICIPVKLDGTENSENQFLKAWIGKTVAQSGMTLNELLNFRGYENGAKFATLEYCLKYNQSAPSVNTYTLCLFDSPLRISEKSIPDWLKNDTNMLTVQTPSPTNPVYRRKTFDEIFNLFMRGRINVYIYSDPDPFLVGTEQHFDYAVKQNVINPAYFSCKTRMLTGKQYSPDQLVSGVKGLHNVKCYPIDLASQVDEGGNIYIDENTNKPVDVNDVLMKPDGSSKIDTSLIDSQLASAGMANRIIYWITFSIIIIIFLAITIAIIIYIFRGSSVGTVPAPEAPVPALGSAPGSAPVSAPGSAPAPLGSAPAGPGSVGSLGSANTSPLTNINSYSVASVLRSAKNNTIYPHY
jgi:hypothetical protein